MNTTIWKFEFETENVFEIKMPKGAKILTVQTRMEKPCLWAMVNPEEEKELRKFRIFGAGGDASWSASDMEKMNYIGIYQLSIKNNMLMLDGGFVGHLFEMY